MYPHFNLKSFYKIFVNEIVPLKMCPFEKFWSVWGTTGVVIKFIFKKLIEKN